MKNVFSVTFLVILVTLECHGDPNTRRAETIRLNVSTTRRPVADGSHMSFPVEGSQVQVYLNQGSQPKDSQTVGSQTTSFPVQGSQSSNSQNQGSHPAQGSRAQGSQPPSIASEQPESGSGSLEPSAVGQRNSDETVQHDPAKGINDQLRQFGLDMLIQLSELDPTSNLIISPFSVWSVLLMILEGARGKTAAQIRRTLNLPDDPLKIRSNYKYIESGLTAARDSAEFESVNGLFYDKNRPLKQDFVHSAEIDFHAELLPIDFTTPAASVRQVNDWVANKTRNRITRLIHLDDVTRPELLVANAIFFKGLWESPFNSSATTVANFYNEQNDHIANVQMMYQKGVYLYSFIREIKAHVLDMPYRGSQFRMLIVLPEKGNTLLNVYRAMKRFPVNECYKRLLAEQEMYSDDLIPVYLPRFKVKNDLTLNIILENLGIEDVFNPAVANMSGISVHSIYLNRMIHISEIEVNEKGTTASSVTGGVFVNKVSPPKFVGNRPFAFFIVEDSRKTVIFAGRVINPNKH